MIGPHGHEQLSGEWAAAIIYDGISAGEAMWLEPNWVCPDWVSNSQFQVVVPFHSWDDAENPVIGRDTGESVISNGEVEITIKAVMREGRAVVGLSPAVAGIDHILSHWYVMLQTYAVTNVTPQVLTNVKLFQMMHGQPNDDYGPNNYGVYDATLYGDPDDGFPSYRYDMTFFAPDANWADYMDDIIGFSSQIAPDAWGLGEFPSDFCSGGEPGPTSLHHLVEADALGLGSVVGPLEVTGAMRWSLGDLAPGASREHTVLFYTGHSPAGLPPSPGRIGLTPELDTNEVGSPHTVTASVTLDGVPVSGVQVTFEIEAGPHQGLFLGQELTDDFGQASVIYEGVLAGTDLIRAYGDTDNDGTPEKSNLATVVWIVAGTPPDCSGASASPAQLWPPNHAFVPIAILGVTDPDGDPVAITIDSIFQDERVLQTGGGAGNTSPDGTGVGTSTAQVRAERNGNPRTPGDGRVYTIGFTADDGNGGTCEGAVTVCVPHDQGPGASCINGGALYDSTTP
jgi:hypothetical protein